MDMKMEDNVLGTAEREWHRTGENDDSVSYRLTGDLYLRDSGRVLCVTDEDWIKRQPC
jgi:hypothetical protein